MKDIYECDCPGCRGLKLAGEVFNIDFDSISEAFKDALRDVHKEGKVTPGLLKKSGLRAYINATSESLHMAVSEGIGKSKIPEQMAAALDNDTFLFSGMKVYNAVKESSLKLREPDGALKTFDRFFADVRQIDEEYNKNYLRAEYGFAVHSAQASTAWAESEESGDRYNLQYRTAGDARVRDEHAALNDITLPKSDPFWTVYYPPNGWNCRCRAIEVRKSKYPESDSQAANGLGAAATAGKAEIFRFNPGKREQVFPPKHPYRSAKCENCDKAALKLAAAIPVNEKCQACRIICGMKETYSVEETGNGKVRVSNFHNRQEKAENLAVAKYFAEKYGEEIDLLGITPEKKNPDAFNRTRNIYQEYKTNKKPTISAIDNEIREAKKQADNIVLKIDSEISDGDLRNALQDRVKRSQSIKEIIIVRNGNDKKYLREDIIKDDFEL
jgi:SPP1 gp7 family putative phage head morphogenesis protein